MSNDSLDRPALTQLVDDILDLLETPVSYRGTTTHALIAAIISEFVTAHKGVQCAQQRNQLAAVLKR